MTRAQIKDLCFKLIKKDPGDSELVEIINSFINVIYKEIAQLDLISTKTTLTLDVNGTAALPIDFYQVNYIEDSNKEHLVHSIEDGLIQVSYLGGTTATGSVTLHYYVAPNDLLLDSDTPKISPVYHNIIPFGVAMLFKLMKDDTLKDDFGAIYERMKGQIVRPTRTNQSVATLY